MVLMNSGLFSYDPGNSFFHKLDPRVKIIGLMVLSPVLFGLNSLLLQSLAFISLIIVIRLSGIRLRKIIRSVSPMFVFIALVFLLQFLFVPEPQNFVDDKDVELITSQMVSGPVSLPASYDEPATDAPTENAGTLSDNSSGSFDGGPPPGGDDRAADDQTEHAVAGRKHPMEKDIFSWGPAHPTLWSLYLAVTVSLKFILLLFMATLVTMTTPKSLMIQAIDRMLSPLPLKLIGLTSRDIALMALLTIRFIPRILSSAYVTTCAAQSRGLVITESPMRYIRLMSGALVPAIFRDAGQIARSMESRGYGRKRKTFYYEMSLKKRDILCLAVLSVIFICVFMHYIAVILYRMQ